MGNSKSKLTPLTAHQAKNFGWCDEGPSRLVMEALAQESPDGSRYVGGCVRDSLIGVRPKDIDIATKLHPDQVVAVIEKAGLQAVPTGLVHGTITAVADHIGVEITTLRSDVSTDGRRATIAFSEDWETDARRRDFRLNAIYLTPDKKLFDPTLGAADILNKRVRFIGIAEERIKEDYLRIMRFFRFSARFANMFDEDGLIACAGLKDGIQSLSAERVGDELSKILTLAEAAIALNQMQHTGVLAMVWPFEANIERLKRLKKNNPASEVAMGLAALFGTHDRTPENKTIDRHLRLSNADAARRKAAVQNASNLPNELDELSAQKIQYRLKSAAFVDALMLKQASDNRSSVDWAKFKRRAESWTPPKFPIGGEDVLALNISHGPAIAEILNLVENHWVNENFPPIARTREILVQAVKGYPH